MYEKFEDDVIDILESVGECTDSTLIKSAEKIHSLADYARQTPLFKDSEQKGNEFFNGMPPIEIYNHMIFKIVDSPTKLHRDAAVILTIPYLSDALKLNST
jgi:hypothetical protein